MDDNPKEPIHNQPANLIECILEALRLKHPDGYDVYHNTVKIKITNKQFDDVLKSIEEEN